MGQTIVPGKCPGTKKPTGEQCKQPAGAGTQHLGWGYCKYHGGNSPALSVKAAKDQLASRLVAFGTPIDVDPAEALLGEVRRSAGIVNWLEEVICEFTQIDRDDLQRDARDALMALGQKGREAAVWVEMYRDERKMLRAASVEALKANIAERQVRVAEEQGRLMAHVIQAVLSDPELALTSTQKVVSRGVAQRHLLMIGGKAS